MPPASSNPTFKDKVSRLRPGVAFILMIFGALIAFEIFNYTTTDHALRDLLGDLTFAGMPWATVLAVAFCGIDFAGIARLFTPEQGTNEPKEVWYLFGAWLLAATMNAILTWWGVSLAVASHAVESESVVDPGMVTSVVPVFVAVMVWVIRILIIGTLSNALDHMLHPNEREKQAPMQALFSGTTHQSAPRQQVARPASIPAGLSSSGYTTRPSTARSASPAPRPSSRPAPVEEEEGLFEPASRSRPEPTYHTLGGAPRPANGGSMPANGNNAGNFRRS